MNEIRVKEVIKDRYNTYFRGLVNKITSQRRSGIAIFIPYFSSQWAHNFETILNQC